MSPILSEILLSGFMINSTLRRRTHLVQSFSVVFLYWFYNPATLTTRVNKRVSSARRPMASPSGSGTSSGSTVPTTSGSEEDMQQQAMDLRKQKRKLSNRDSARRSRMRKQKHLDDLTTHVAHLRKEKNQILASLKAITQQYVAMETENSVLKVQAMELGTRLQSLRDITMYMDEVDGGFLCEGVTAQQSMDSFLMNPWNSLPVNQAIIASADMFQY
ncbi:hypothetical protein Taro_053162 [Colocasia esculenta]|uniref:BZIP domain-containing protein n=1 Tax=Colocasia esculenta TaxID=4460 RepID=A0A843XMB8_COLES|nr:hypothetical protein [Colocasia esculenta]